MTKIDNEGMGVLLKKSWSINGNYMYKNAIFVHSKRCL
jgi:hypothetical protein